MPMPAGANALMLGGVLMDLRALGDEDCSPAMRDILEKILASWIGSGCPSGDNGAGFNCQAVYYANGNFYGGNPSDPTNPDLLLSSAGGTFIVQEEGTPLTARGTLNFIGASVTAADDAGNDRTNITIVGGSSNSFETIVCDAGTSPVADSATDTVTFIGGNGITTTGNSGADSVTWDVDIAASKGLEFISNQLACKAGLYIDVDASGINVDLTEVSGYSGAATQLLGHVAGTIQFKTIAEWLNLLPGYVSGNDQSIGHDASGSTEWQDDTNDCPS